MEAAFRSQWDNVRGTLMPCSPGVEYYDADLMYSDDTQELNYNVEYKLRPVTKWLIDSLPAKQLLHRSRSAVVGFSPLRHNELDKRKVNLEKSLSTLRDAQVSERESLELYQIYSETVLEYFAKDYVFIKKYVNEHETSSLGQSFHWDNLSQFGEAEWTEIYQIVKESWETVLRRPGSRMDVRWQTGSRARSPELENLNDIDNQHGDIDRTRIIQFSPALSFQNVFLPKRKDFKKKLMARVEEVLKPAGEEYFALVEGGQIYSKFSEFVADGGKFTAYDGKHWESSSGILLGKAFSTLMVPLGGHDQLPTGAFFTTDLNTIAAVAAVRDVDCVKFIHSDDINTFNLKTDISSSWMEYQRLDTEFKLILGSSFAHDALWPRICGLKLMSDRAQSMIPFGIPHSYERQFLPRIKGKNSFDEISIWVGLYHGYYGTGSLLEALKDVNLRDASYIAPSKIYDELTTKGELSKAQELAEILGTKALIYG
jgi:hypothetical protein